MSKKENIFLRSLGELKNPRCLTIAAIFIALNVAMDFLNLRIQVLPTQRISLGFLCNAAVAMLFGPAVSIIMGFCTDVFGWLLNPGGGAYFPGFTLTAMTAGVIWGLFLYPRRVTVIRCLIPRILISMICNVGMNTLWLSMIQGKGMMLILPAKLMTNLIIFPFQTVLLYLVLKLVLKQYNRVFLLPEKH